MNYHFNQRLPKITNRVPLTQYKTDNAMNLLMVPYQNVYRSVKYIMLPVVVYRIAVSHSCICFSRNVQREMNDYSNLIVSECLPEVSRPALQSLDDEERNAHSVGKSDGVSIIPPCASAVRSLEMKTI